MNKAHIARREYWKKIIAEQEKSGRSVSAFCLDREVGEHSFYIWRQRLRKLASKEVSFALIDTKPKESRVGMVEFELATGDRLRIPAEAELLRTVLAALRAQQA